MKKLIAFTLLAVLLLTAVLGCSDKGNEQTDGTTAAQGDTAAVETAFLDSIPSDVSYDGYNYRIGYGSPYEINECAYTLEEAAGDLINEAVYERNRIVEDKLNITISADELCTWTSLLTRIQTMITAGDCPYDEFRASAWFMFKCSINGLLTSLYDVSTLDLDHEWWDAEADQMYSLNSNSIYFASGMINYLDDYATSCMYFNKRISDENNIAYPYDLVRSGDWTIAKFIEYAKSFGSDVNGDSKYNGSDTYGYSDNVGAMTRMFNGCGVSVLEISDEGSITVNTSEKLFDVFDAVFEPLYDSSVKTTLIVERSVGYDIGDTLFPNGQVLIKGDALIGNTAAFRQTMEDDFGIVPCPKFDENQENYYDSYNTAWGSVVAIPITNGDTERTGWILEALGSCSKDTVYNAVVEKTVLTKATRDEESVEMVQLIFTTKFFELGQWGSSVYGVVCDQVKTAVNTLSSKLESVASATEEEFSAVGDYYKYN